ncbi:MAG: hypothetical protein EZS28_014743, partial [Streblomastix strix]
MLSPDSELLLRLRLPVVGCGEAIFCKVWDVDDCYLSG